MWIYVSLGLAGAIIILYDYHVNKRSKLMDTINQKVTNYNNLVIGTDNAIAEKDKTINDLEDKIQQISTADGISPEYREIIDNLESQSIKDKEQIANYETELADSKAEIDRSNRMIDTLKSDIVAMKSKPKRDRFGKVHSKKPSVNINIPLKDIPKQALIQSIYFIETSDIGLKHTTFKEIVKILGYDGSLTNCKIIGSLLRNMHFKVKRSREGMTLLLDNDRNRKKLITFYAKYCDDKKQ